jgi:hypothetical protein
VDLVEDTVGVLDAHGIEGAQNWGVSLGGPALTRREQ